MFVGSGYFIYLLSSRPNILLKESVVGIFIGSDFLTEFFQEEIEVVGGTVFSVTTLDESVEEFGGESYWYKESTRLCCLSYVYEGAVIVGTILYAGFPVSSRGNILPEVSSSKSANGLALLLLLEVVIRLSFPFGFP